MIWRNIFSVRVNYSFFYTAVSYNEHSMEIMKFTLILLCQKFRESNVFTKELIWRNIFSVRVKVSFSHTVMWKLMNSSFTNLFTKILWNQFFLQRNFFIFFSGTNECFHHVYVRQHDFNRSHHNDDYDDDWSSQNIVQH